MKKFSGVYTALITPFLNGQVDKESLRRLVSRQIEEGVDGFVINGTTAESPTLEREEIKQIFDWVKLWAPQHPLIFGTGLNSTAATVELTKLAQGLGADAALVVVPYYNKPPQRGLVQHFQKVADATNIPLILYNVPSRTITALDLDSIKTLSRHPRIVGIKEASGNINFARQIRESCGAGFSLLSGDDGTYDEFVAVGGDGVISVSSHIIPREMKAVQARQWKDLIDLLFCEANPIPVKKALSLMGVIRSAECRLPLVEISQEKATLLENEMRKKGLLR